MPEKISIMIEIQNLSTETKKIIKDSRINYVNDKLKPIGNYIIEMQKLETDRFVPFPPNADIDPSFQKTAYHEIKPNGIIMETITLHGNSWSSKGFPKGNYRLRIALNWDEWSS